MKLIVPQAITLVSSNVSGSTYGEWASGTTYAIGNQVKVTDSSTGFEREYESLAGSNIGNDPTIDAGTNWLYLGYSNKHKMFDNFTNTITTNTTSIVIEITGESYIDTVALFNLDAVEVQIIAESSGVEIYNETFDLVDADISDAYEYFFAGFEFKNKLAISGDVLGLYPSIVLTIKITAETGESAGCGHIVIGRGVNIGWTEYTPSISITDYSTRETNEFGETYLLQRAYADIISADVNLYSAAIDIIRRRLTAVHSIPCVWDFNNQRASMSTEYSALLVYGFYKNFDLMLESYKISTCSLEIEGLI